MSIELKQAAQRALNALDEATTYTGSPSWSPSMTDECIAAASALRTALAQQPATGEPFGYIHHFAAHDERGALIDTTWEADGCADPLPHPTFPAMWKWSHCTPFYTTPQPSQVAQAEAQQPATPKPVGFTYQAEIAYADSTGGNGSFWRVPPDLDDEAVPLYTHPAPSAPADVVRDAERYRWLRDNWFTMGASYPEDTVKFHLGNDRWSEQPESNLDSAIDAAMLAAKEAK